MSYRSTVKSTIEIKRFEPEPLVSVIIWSMLFTATQTGLFLSCSVHVFLLKLTAIHSAMKERKKSLSERFDRIKEGS